MVFQKSQPPYKQGGGSFTPWSFSFLVEAFTGVALKSNSQLPPPKFYIYFNDSPSKIMKNAFYFILKALFVLKIFKFLF